jgi:Fe-S cluster assembly protein SufD
MAVQLDKDGNYGAAFRELLKQRADEPSWLRRAREDAFARFESVGFPTVGEEEWKYTNVTPIARANFRPAITTAATGLKGNVNSLLIPEAKNSRLVFVNGILQRELSSSNVGDQVVIADLSESLRDPETEALVKEQFENTESENGFAALNAALFSGGAFVQIPRGMEVASPIHLLFISQANNGDAPASFPRVLIIAEENSSATILESYSAIGTGAYFTNAIVDVVAKPGARIEHYKVQRENTSAFHVATTSAQISRGARYDTASINVGAQLARHDIDVGFNEEGGECAVDGLYMIGAEQHSDTHSVIDHSSAHCTSRQLYKGVLDGKSHAVFNGKVFVRHGAQQTDAQQTNKNLLLSEDARVDTKPQLEIFADDVKCAHGAAVGQLNDDEIFYLESRGINPALARNMLTYGFAEEVIEKIKIESIQRELNEVVLNQLHSGLQI